MTTIRLATRKDDDELWRILEPTLRAGETYPQPRDIAREVALAYWWKSEHAVFVAEEEGRLLGTYVLHPNRGGGGAHVANCGYMTAADAHGRGIGAALCRHSLDEARRAGFRAMQFNFVLASNERAVALWHRMGFETVGRVPEAFLHPALGYVDALVMYRRL